MLAARVVLVVNVGRLVRRRASGCCVARLARRVLGGRRVRLARRGRRVLLGRLRRMVAVAVRVLVGLRVRRANAVLLGLVDRPG